MKPFNECCFLVTDFRGEPSTRIVHGWDNVLLLLGKWVPHEVMEDLHDDSKWSVGFHDNEKRVFLAECDYLSIVRVSGGLPYIHETAYKELETKANQLADVLVTIADGILGLDAYNEAISLAREIIATREAVK